MSCSISSSWPWVHTRGASTACWSVMPWSMRLTTAWNTDVKMRTPPGRPSAQAGLPSRSTMVGAMLLVTRLPGAMEAGVPGSGSKSATGLLGRMPRPRTLALAPQARAWEDVQRRDGWEPAGGGRRGARDLKSAVAAEKGPALAGLVAREISQGDDAAGGAHLAPPRRAEAPAIEHARALGRDEA